jgi:hypothetical protein
MSTITTRAAKGSALTHAEVDANFTNLNTGKAEVSGQTFTGPVVLPAGSATAGGVQVGTGTTYKPAIYSPGTDQLAISTGGTGRLFVDSSGRLGIGTSSPQALLNVSTASTSGDQNVVVCGTAATGIAGSHALYLGAYGSTQYGCKIKSIYNYSATVNTELSFEISKTGTLIEAARLDSSGRLLVGTSTARNNIYFGTSNPTPNVQFESVTNSYSAGLSLLNYSFVGYAPVLNIGLSQTNTQGTNALVGASTDFGIINFVGNDGGNFRTGAWIQATTDGTPASGSMPGRLVFSTTASGSASPTERVRIDSSGKLLVGTTALPSTSGGAGVGIDNFNGTVGRITIGKTLSGNTDGIPFYYSGTYVGGITYSNTAVAYLTSSDYRLKENVAPLSSAIDRVNQLQVYRFNFLADPDRTVDGFIAHEAQAVVPECVSGEKDAVDENGNPVYQGIDQSKLVPLLTAALQEAIAKIESLESRITALEP